MSREVSPPLSALVVKLLKEELSRRRRSGKYSQNMMAAHIGVKGGTLSGIMSGKRGVGDDVLPKIEAFLGTTRADLYAQVAADATVATSAPAPTQPTTLDVNIERVRHWLYRRYDKALVDETVAIFATTFTVAGFDLLDMADLLENQIRMAEIRRGKGAGEQPEASPKEAPLGRRRDSDPSSTLPPERVRFERQAEQLAKGSTTRRGKHAGK